MSKVKTNTNLCEDLSSSSRSSSSLSSDEEIDARDLKSIKDYLLDRRELARQLFKSVKPEKIRMMLPQTLKKVDLGDLEEWCAAELSGMSKTRILNILNGKPMVESSNTSESDDSGPSLEIISDTEEWFTDEGTSKQDENSKTNKMKTKKDKVKLNNKSHLAKKNDAKLCHKKSSLNKNKDVEIKKENETEKKNKEGDSLLDLLELEMRARAIRALIRKEEDVIPTPNTSTSVNHDRLNEKLVTKITQDDLKDKENCRKQLERIISAQRGTTGDDEDVVLVVQPTPTIELLTSDSEEEGHNGARINQKFQNERVLDTEKNIDVNKNGNIKNIRDSNTVENTKENSQETTESCRDLDTRKHDVLKRAHSVNVDNKNTQSPTSTKPSRKKRKLKKKSHSKEKLENSNAEKELHPVKPCNTENATFSKSLTSSVVTENVSNVQLDSKELEHPMELKAEKGSPLPGEQSSTKQQEVANKTISDEDKSTDSDEIIDLDDYCNDMEDMENNENDKNNHIPIIKSENCTSQVEIGSTRKSNAAETWASRYYQTDDVQNVIKESKIQSEIRKRLRERQRLSKLNKSPNSNSPSSPSVAETTDNKSDQKPTGSVGEYLALKRTASESLSTNGSNDGIVPMEDKDISNNGTCNDVNRHVTSNMRTASTHSKESDVDEQGRGSEDGGVNSPLITEKTETVNASSA